MHYAKQRTRISSNKYINWLRRRKRKRNTIPLFHFILFFMKESNQEEWYYSYSNSYYGVLSALIKYLFGSKFNRAVTWFECTFYNLYFNLKVFLKYNSKWLIYLLASRYSRLIYISWWWSHWHNRLERLRRTGQEK